MTKRERKLLEEAYLWPLFRALQCWAGYEELRDRLGRSERSLRRDLRRLRSIYELEERWMPRPCGARKQWRVKTCQFEVAGRKSRTS